MAVTGVPSTRPGVQAPLDGELGASPDQLLPEGDQTEALAQLLSALEAARAGHFQVRLEDGGSGRMAQIGGAFNDLMAISQAFTGGLVTIARVVGREGRMTERLRLDGAGGAWADGVEAVNSLTDDLARPTTEVARVIVAVADGDLSQKMALEIEGQPVKGEFLRIGTAVNTMVDQLSSFAAEVTRVDPDSIARVLDNLVNNALVHAGIRPFVRVVVSEGDPCIRVEDRGPGVPPELGERIFERFVRGSNDGSGPPGVGLGLHICRELVLAAGGSLALEPGEGGRGSRFVVRLPPAPAGTE